MKFKFQTFFWPSNAILNTNAKLIQNEGLFVFINKGKLSIVVVIVAIKFLQNYIQAEIIFIFFKHNSCLFVLLAHGNSAFRH